MNSGVKPSIPMARCLGPVVFHEKVYIDRTGMHIPWEEVPLDTLVLCVKRALKRVNTLNRALWNAAEELSFYGEGQDEIFSLFIENADKELEEPRAKQ